MILDIWLYCAYGSIVHNDERERICAIIYILVSDDYFCSVTGSHSAHYETTRQILKTAE